MNLIAEAEKSLARNWRPVAAFVVGVVVAVSIYRFGYDLLDARVPEEVTPKPGWYVLSTLALEIALAAAVAAMQAVAFAIIGAEIDRPMWKYQGPRDAVERFFSTWFIVSLIHFAIIRMQVSFYDQGLIAAVAAMDLPRIFWQCISLPFAACIMYGGRLVWREIPERLAPLSHFLGRAMITFLLGFLSLVLADVIFASMSEEFRKTLTAHALVNLILVPLDCLIFAAAWLICIDYRNSAPERGDDLDF